MPEEEMGARLLIIDDEALQMRALCDTLGFEGFRTKGYTSPKEALATLKPGENDLLLTDLMMPEVDGIELIKRARAIDPHLECIVMTGHGAVDSAVAAMQSGALDYIVKPFKLNVILTTVRRALDVRHLRAENLALQQRERERAQELASAYGDLEAFSYSVSHDLRSPLRAVRGYADIFMETYAQVVPADGRSYLEKVIAATERMDHLIVDLLKFCRYSRAPINKRILEMRQIAHRVVEQARMLDSARNIEVEIAPLPSAMGDPSLIEQVFVNLIGNAFKFTRARNPARVQIGFFTPADSNADRTGPTYYVRDNGDGFDMSHADRLFGVFQRLHSNDTFEGTGIGLSIVQRILQRHGGRAWAEAARGEGATFYFTL